MSLKQAAEATGKSKSTLSRAIKSGKLSAQRDDAGFFIIDPSELSRCYPIVMHRSAPDDASRNSQKSHDDAEFLRLKLELLNEELTRERLAAERERDQLTTTVDDLRERLNRAEQRVTALISNQSMPARRRWWFW